MERWRNFFEPTQDAAKQYGELPAVCAGLRLFEQMVVAAVEQPHFVWNASSVWAKRVVISLHVNDALSFLFFLANDIAKHTALFFLEPFAGGAQFVLDAPGHENRAGNFRVGVGPFLACEFALVLENADIFETN